MWQSKFSKKKKKAKNCGNKKIWAMLLFKQDTWEELLQTTQLAAIQHATAKRILKNKQDLCGCSELHIAICYQEEYNSSR